MNILQEICLKKKKEIEVLKKKFDKSFFLKNKKNNVKRNFIEALKQKSKKKYNLIAEIKKKSPSKGNILDSFDPVKIALDYEKAGAICLSVLTEKEYFDGDPIFIELIKKKVKIPILRKDFIIDEFQIYESIYYGADCILLILAVINDQQLKKFSLIAKQLGLDVLTEVHDEHELKRALNNGAECIGINNRNLKTLEINLNTFPKLASLIPSNIVKVCESGISNKEELFLMENKGADAFLIGHSLIQKRDILNSTKQLITKIYD